MENDLREILREKADKHREYYSSIVGSDNTDVNSGIEQEMARQVLDSSDENYTPNSSTTRNMILEVLEMNDDGILLPNSGNIGSVDKKTRTRRRGVYEIGGTISELAEFKSVKVLRENYLAMLEKTSNQLNEKSNQGDKPLGSSETSENLVKNSESLEKVVEKLEMLTKTGELLVPPSSGYGSGNSDDETDKNWSNPERRSGNSDSAVHSDDEGPITSNWGEKKEKISNEGEFT